MEGKRKNDLSTGTIPKVRRKLGEVENETEKNKDGRARKRSGDLLLYPTIDKETAIPTAEVTGKRQEQEDNQTEISKKNHWNATKFRR